MVENMIKVWHGTSASRLDSIMDKGLIPNYLPPPGGTSGNTKNAIYLFKSKDEAVAQIKLFKDMVLLEITLPNNGLMDGEEDYELVYKKIIPPHLIRQIL